jgi:hypothetical protein
MIPSVPPRCEDHNLRLEDRRIIESADVDANHVWLGYRLVVERRAARPAEPFQLLRTGIRGSGYFRGPTGYPNCRAREHHDGRMSGARIPLTVSALTLEGSNRLGGDLIADCAAGTAASVYVRHHARLDRIRCGHPEVRLCELLTRTPARN